MTEQLKLSGYDEVIYFVEAMLHQAISYGASDIHLEKYEQRVRLRYRLDGVLQEVLTDSLFETQYIGIVCRIKLLAALDIAEHRLPQDGAFSFNYQHGLVDIRVSTVPLISGERIVLRILDSTCFGFGLEQLGMATQPLSMVRKSLQTNQGMLLVTGPTGSGKTTTLYAAIEAINQTAVNILTVENPVEYRIDGINQVEVKDTIGLDFAQVLRAFLRQDPEVILVGEVRDYETADIAIKSALTGHLVMTTLHTRDAASTIARLINIGVPAYLVAAAINLIICQRLVRRTCEHCKEPCVPKDLLLLGDSIEGEQFFYGRGCSRCRHTGFSGRCAIYEMVELDAELQRAISAYTQSPEAVNRELCRQRTSSLRQEGLKLLHGGNISPQEYLRVLGS